MIDLYSLLPRVIQDRDEFLNYDSSTTQLFVFSSLHSNKTIPERCSGSYTLPLTMTLNGVRLVLLTENSTENDAVFQVAVNGIPNVGSQFTISAGMINTVDIVLPNMGIIKDDIVSLYCVSKGSEVGGIYIEINLRFIVTEYQQYILKKLISALDSEVLVEKFLLDKLTELVDIEDCPEIYLPYIAHFLGMSVINNWDADRKRLFISSLIHMYKISGQMISFEAILRFFSYSVITVKELYKEIIYEINNYSELGELRFATKLYGLFIPGSILGNQTFPGFVFPGATIISGMESVLITRDGTSGPITIYLTLNGVTDYARYLTIPVGSSHGNSEPYYFPELEVDAGDIIGFDLRITSPGGGDGWLQVYLDVEYHGEFGYHAARVNITDMESFPNNIQKSLDSFRPIHVIVRYKNGLEIVNFDTVDYDTEETINPVSGAVLSERLSLIDDDLAFSSCLGVSE